MTNPELSAVRDADRVIGILNTSDIEPIQLVINRVRPNMMASQEMLSIEDVQGILSLPLLGIVLEDEQVIISTNRGEPLTLTDTRSPAKKCYLNVSQRLTGKDVPIIDPKNEGKSLKDKFMRLMQTKVFKMMTLRDLINKLLGRETASANTARERLQLVLAHDRVDMNSLSTDLLDKMKKKFLTLLLNMLRLTSTR